jgi:hypothetical protein
MVVPHYVYLLLKMLGKAGVLTFHGDLKNSYEVYASTTRMLEPSSEVFAAAQQLSQSEMVIQAVPP